MPGPLEGRDDRLLGPALEGGEHAHLGGVVGIVELLGDAAEEHLAQDLALVRLTHSSSRVVGREERDARERSRCPGGRAVSVSLMRPTLPPGSAAACSGERP